MKAKYFLPAALIGLSGALVSCEDDGTVKLGPRVDIISPTGTATANAGGTVSVEVSASTNDKLETFVLDSRFGGFTSTLIDSTLDNGTTSYTFTGEVPAATSAGTQFLDFTFTDNKDGSTTKTLEVNVLDLGADANGQVWNVRGPNKGAYDLVGDSAVAASVTDLIKDLQDQTGNDLLFTPQWSSNNNTEFVRDNSLNFDSASLQDVVDAYNNGTPSATTPVLLNGDVIIASNARFPKGYVLIRVDQVSNTPADNLDNITFTYKK